MRRESVVIAEVAHRLGRCVAEFRSAIADIDAPQAGAAVDQLPSALVPDPDAGTARDDRRTVLQVVGDRRRRMDQALAIHLLERVICCGHYRLLLVDLARGPLTPTFSSQAKRGR